MSIWGRVTKLTVDLRFVNKYANRYNLDSIFNLFEGFSKLEDLTIISDETKIEEYILLRQSHTLPTLRKYKSATDAYKSFDYKRLVSFAPNLEHLDVMHLKCDDLDDLLPLSGSLRKIQAIKLSYWNKNFDEYSYDANDDGINSIIDRFIDKMPSLISLQFDHCWRKPPGRLRTLPKKLRLRNSTAKWENLGMYELQRFDRRFNGTTISDEFTILNMVICWFLQLEEKDNEKEKIRAVYIIRQFVSMLESSGQMLGTSYKLALQNVHKLLCVENIGNQDGRHGIFNEIKTVNNDGRWYLYTTELPKFQQQIANTFKIEVDSSGTVIRNYDIS